MKQQGAILFGKENFGFFGLSPIFRWRKWEKTHFGKRQIEYEGDAGRMNNKANERQEPLERSLLDPNAGVGTHLVSIPNQILWVGVNAVERRSVGTGDVGLQTVTNAKLDEDRGLGVTFGGSKGHNYLLW